MMSRANAERPHKHIRPIQVTGSNFNDELQSDEQEVLSQTKSIIGKEQVNRKQMECTLPWIARKEMRKEHDDKWSAA